MKHIRVLIVEDSLTECAYLEELVGRTAGMSVVGTARDGRDAVQKCKLLRPDVMTLDMVLPTMNGVEVTEHIMAECPTPILVVSAAANRADMVDTLDALVGGAVDVLEKPDRAQRDDAWNRRFISALRIVSRVAVVTHPRGRLRPRRDQDASSTVVADNETLCEVVGLGASTGGPSAIAQILRELPSSFPIPILVVVHMAPSFGDTFVQWLDSQSVLPVVQVESGTLLPPRQAPAKVFVAPADQHLVLRGRRLCLSGDPEVHGCRPAVDLLFESLAKELRSRACGCLLTGMGRDGAAGLLAIRQAGGATATQDEATCAVFGMPREALRLNAAQRVLALSQVASWLLSIALRRDPVQ